MLNLISLETLLSFHRGGQTDFQNDRFVTVRAGGTPYGCLVQSLRELWKRFRGLRDDFAQRELLRIDIEELAETSVGESFAARRARVELARKRMALIEVEKHIETDSREFMQFYCQAAAIYAHLGLAERPPTKDQIDLLDRERWEHNILCTLAIDCMAGAGPLRNTIELIQCLPTEGRERILRRAFGPTPMNQQTHRPHVESLIQWYLNYTPNLPAPLSLTADQSRGILSSCESEDLPMPLRISLATDVNSSAGNNTPSDFQSVKPALAASA
ncbi:MAG: hypothetical protein ACT4QC_00395 [Planctomycetaceae bacterium]